MNPLSTCVTWESKNSPEKVRSQSGIIVQIDAFESKNRPIPHNAFSKLSTDLRVPLSRYKRWMAQPVSTNSIFVSSTIVPRDGGMFSFRSSRYQSFETDTDNDVYFAVTRSPLICTRAFCGILFQKLHEAIRLCSLSEIARGIKSSMFALNCIIFDQSQVRWACLEIRFFKT